MNEDRNQLPPAGPSAEIDVGRRRLFKAAVKGVAVGVPLVVTLRGGNAWANSVAPCATRNNGAPANPGAISCIGSTGLP